MGRKVDSESTLGRKVDSESTYSQKSTFGQKVDSESTFGQTVDSESIFNRKADSESAFGQKADSESTFVQRPASHPFRSFPGNADQQFLAFRSFPGNMSTSSFWLSSPLREISQLASIHSRCKFEARVFRNIHDFGGSLNKPPPSPPESWGHER